MVGVMMMIIMRMSAIIQIINAFGLLCSIHLLYIYLSSIYSSIYLSIYHPSIHHDLLSTFQDVVTGLRLCWSTWQVLTLIVTMSNHHPPPNHLHQITEQLATTTTTRTTMMTTMMNVLNHILGMEWMWEPFLWVTLLVTQLLPRNWANSLHTIPAVEVIVVRWWIHQTIHSMWMSQTPCKCLEWIWELL